MLAFTASAVCAADVEWDPEKSWTLENNHSHDGYLASNNRTGATNSAQSGDASGYRFIVNAEKVFGNLAAAYSKEGNVSGNQLEVSSNSNIELGDGMMVVSVNIIGARTQKGTAENNTLIFAGSVDKQATIAGGFSQNGSANKNTLEFSGTASHSNPSIYGGYAFSSSNDEANADGNRLIVSGKITGSGSSVAGGHTRSAGHANSNIVELMSTAEVHGDIAGGYSYEGNVESNQVTILEGADFYGDTIYGGGTH